LDGIWASAPYLHNGSVPTLWHVLHPSDRPLRWRRTEQGLDTQRIGFVFETFEKITLDLSAFDRRWYFDTTQFGKSKDGHLFPDSLLEEDKASVLEYLKSL